MTDECDGVVSCHSSVDVGRRVVRKLMQEQMSHHLRTRGARYVFHDQRSIDHVVLIINNCTFRATIRCSYT